MSPEFIMSRIMPMNIQCLLSRICLCVNIVSYNWVSLILETCCTMLRKQTCHLYITANSPVNTNSNKTNCYNYDKAAKMHKNIKLVLINEAPGRANFEDVYCRKHLTSRSIQSNSNLDFLPYFSFFAFRDLGFYPCDFI